MVLSLAQYQMILDRLSRFSEMIDLNTISYLKNHFRDKINSARTLERIITLSQLLKVLEKRCVISCAQVSALHYITDIVAPNDTIIQNIFDNGYNRPISSRNYNLNNYMAVNSMAVNERVLPPASQDLLERINSLVRNDIGYRWKELARALDVGEGNIDALDAYHRGIPNIVNEILQLHQEKYGFNFELWRSKLQDALATARRRDLSDSINDILTQMPAHPVM